MTDEQDVQCLFKDRGRFVVVFGEMVHHIKQIPSITQLRLGLIHLSPDSCAKGCCSNGGSLAEQAKNLLVHDCFVIVQISTREGWIRLGMIRTHRRNRRDKNTLRVFLEISFDEYHGVRIIVEALYQVIMFL